MSDIFTVQVSTACEHNIANSLGTYENPDVKNGYVEFLYANVRWTCFKILLYDLACRVTVFFAFIHYRLSSCLKDVPRHTCEA